MNDSTWQMLMTWAPWVMVIVLLAALYDYARDAWHKKVQKASHQFSAMGSTVITNLLDAIARSDRPAMVSAIEQIIDRYGGERGALLFGWEVFSFWIDDALKDAEYKDRVGDRLAVEIFGKLFTPEIKIGLGKVAANFGDFGLRSAQSFFSGLATGHIDQVEDAMRDILNRFGDADQVDDEIVKLAPKIVARIKSNYPEHIPALRAILLTLEEQAKVATPASSSSP